mmetsp:Transcript_33663/g.53921  ORF Transcript_33663/g.53921 Transcript_33663/m.53921 type:complete len:214 (+) Transcript_33663:1106-1747(+)
MHLLHISDALNADRVVWATWLLLWGIGTLFYFHHRLDAGRFPQTHLLKILFWWILCQCPPRDTFAREQNLFSQPFRALGGVLITQVRPSDLAALFPLLHDTNVYRGCASGGLCHIHQLLPELILKDGLFVIELLQKAAVHRLQFLSLSQLLLPCCLLFLALLPRLSSHLRQVLLNLFFDSLGLFLLRILCQPFGQEVNSVLGLHLRHLGQRFG